MFGYLGVQDMAMEGTKTSSWKEEEQSSLSMLKEIILYILTFVILINLIKVD